MAVTPSIPDELSRALVLRLMAEASPSEKLDEAAFEAFGLSASTPDTIRWIMHGLWNEGLRSQGAWFAGKLLTLKPDDLEAAEVLASARAAGISPSREMRIRLLGPGRLGVTR